MPYDSAYTFVPPSGYGEPYQYVYYSPYGWTWLAAPWVWGYGAWPWFGAVGPYGFAWYGYGYWRTPYAYRYAPYYRTGPVAPLVPGRGGGAGVVAPSPVHGGAAVTGGGAPAAPAAPAPSGGRGGGHSGHAR
jgi:hypothetical protein